MQKIVLYLTSKAFRQTIDHAVKEAGLVTLDCNNVIGNTVSIEEFMNKKGYLHSMFVHKDMQGKGVATQLLI